MSVKIMTLPISKLDIEKHYLDYTWLISGVLYEGGTDLLIPELMKRGINEAHFYNVAGSPIVGKQSQGSQTHLTLSNSMSSSRPTKLRMSLILYIAHAIYRSQIRDLLT